MPTVVCVCEHNLKNFDEWLEIFKANKPPTVGKWRVVRGIDDPNRVNVVGELQTSEVDEVKTFLASERMQDVFRRVNEMSTAPLRFVWFEHVSL